MRFPKYRAYIKSLKWMVPVLLIDFKHEYVTVDLTDGQGDVAEYGFDEVYLMQWTGLKDKSDVDIYEGDVLSNGEHINWQVGFHEGSFKVVLTNPLNTDKWILDRSRAGTREVIGNIWENKELRDNW